MRGKEKLGCLSQDAWVGGCAPRNLLSPFQANVPSALGFTLLGLLGPLDTPHCQYGAPTTPPTPPFPESGLSTPTARLLFMLFPQPGISFPLLPILFILKVTPFMEHSPTSQKNQALTSLGSPTPQGALLSYFVLLL